MVALTGVVLLDKALKVQILVGCGIDKNKSDAKRVLMDDICQSPGPLQVEGTDYDVKSIGLCEEDEDYITNIKEFQAQLDTLKKLVKPGCSEELLKVALSSMASLVEILTFMSSTPKLHASL